MNQISLPSLEIVAESCAVLCGINKDGVFEHLGTAWSLAEGEWVTVWEGQAAPPATGICLLHVFDGTISQIEQWESDGVVAGFRSTPAKSTLSVMSVDDGSISKREALLSVGYPCVIDHPSFGLARKSLNAERYVPYCCPWRLQGHLALFTAEEGYLTGRYYAGMNGSPVLNEAGQVVGIITGGEPAPDHPPLTRFRRLV